MFSDLFNPLHLNPVALVTAWVFGTSISHQIKLGSAGPIAVGKSVSEPVEFFGGIHYAEAPVDNLRLREARIKDYSVVSDFTNVVVDATDFGKACLQPGMPRESVSEDCLSLNIFRPSAAQVGPNASLPVLLWIHGGGWVSGAGSRPGYDGTALVERSLVRNSPVIVITINYRLGPLGFPQGEEVDGRQDVLNLGLKDQLVALEWVKQNIETFGGDPSKITVFGESAGGRSIELLILNGKLQGLARGAIIQSVGRLPTHPARVREAKWTSYVRAVPSCAEASSKLDCLRLNANSDELYDALDRAGITSSSFDWAAVLDGPGGLVPDYPSQLDIPSGGNIAIMYGDVLDEGTMATPQDINSSEEILSGLFDVLSPSPRGDDVLRRSLTELLQLYPDDPSAGSPFDTGNETFGLNQEFKRYAAIFTDIIASVERRVFARKFAESKSASAAPLYMYLFADPNAVSVVPREFRLPEGSYARGSLGVPHTSEILHVFGNLDVENSTMPRSAKDLSTQMMDYWISFAVNLDPNDDSGSNPGPHWPEYFSSSPTNGPVLLQLKGDEIVPVPDTFRETAITYIDEHSVVFDA
ncbi:hypothetical protein PM082_017750 [Marasmius tenuissimus]|nr:hypothetical protein PM082_017750 [Marasmius tenuissimus]